MVRIRKPTKILSVNMDLDLYEEATEVAAMNKIRNSKDDQMRLSTVSKIVNQALRDYLSKTKKVK